MIPYKGIDYGCWIYKDAAVLVNEAISARKWESKYNNILLLKDSLTLDLTYSNMEFILMTENHSLCVANSTDRDAIIINKDLEIGNIKVIVKQQKTQKWVAIGLAGLFAYLAITK